MEPAVAASAGTETPLFRDGFGDRILAHDPFSGETLEILHLAPCFAAVASVESALRERASRLADFHHESYAHVRRIDRSDTGQLAIVSEHASGGRLSEILRAVERRHRDIDRIVALAFVRQLVAALAALHAHAPELAHGAVAPERLIVSPDGRLVVTEHVLGSALEQMELPRDRIWSEFRVAAPAAAGAPRLDARTDVVQVAMVALALLLGRPIRGDEFPQHLSALLDTATEPRADGQEAWITALRGWLTRALQIDRRNSFRSVTEARAELRQLVAANLTSPDPVSEMDAFLREFHDLLRSGPIPVAEPVTPPSMPAYRRREALGLSAMAIPIPTLRPAPAPKRPASDGSVAPAPPVPAGRVNAPPQTRYDATPRSSGRHAAAIARPPATIFSGWKRKATMALALVAIAAAAYLGTRALTGGLGRTGALTIETRPPGAQVLVDGTPQGVTPIRVPLSAGSHTIELKAGRMSRVVPMRIEPGMEMMQYVELGEGRALGQLDVRTEPPGARVTIDGRPRGVAPLVADLAPGRHTVRLQSDLGVVEQQVSVERGATTTLVVPIAGAGAPVSGWLSVSVSSPVDVQLFEAGRLLGTTESDRILVSAGRHQIDFVNETLGFRSTRTLRVLPGQVLQYALELPKGTLDLNAVPWAEVWIDGQRVGDTPLGNVEVPIGPHEIVFRHPQLGEQRHAVTVTLSSPTHVSVDLRQ